MADVHQNVMYTETISVLRLHITLCFEKVPVDVRRTTRFVLPFAAPYM
jgi:hypothetical protein